MIAKADRTVCFYHRADFDGICSAAIVRMEYPDAEFIGVDHHDAFPWEAFTPDDRVVMVDFSLPRDGMILLQRRCREFIWIDHHKRALTQCADLAIEGERDPALATCELTYMHFFHSPSASSIPEAIRLIGRYDTWDLHWSPDVLPFQYGLRAFDGARDLYNDIWMAVIADDGLVCDGLIQAGNNVLTYVRNESAMMADELAYDLTTENGLRLLCMNRPFVNAMAFESLYEPGKHDLYVAWCHLADGRLKYSIYAPPGSNADAAELAARYGGGGHPGAAGFVSSCRVF